MIIIIKHLLFKNKSRKNAFLTKSTMLPRVKWLKLNSPEMYFFVQTNSNISFKVSENLI